MRLLHKIGLATSSVVVTVLVAEVAFRTVGVGEARAQRIEDLRKFLDGGHELFMPWVYSGYVVKDKRKKQHDATRPKSWRFDLSGDPDRLRVACLGGSTTHGGYPTFLAVELAKRRKTPTHVMNWGAPGWTTAETMVNYFTNVQDYGADVLVIHHALNDVPPRRTDGYRSDYAHYRHPWVEFDMPAWQRWLVRRSDLFAMLHVGDPTRFELGAFVEFSGQKRVSRDAPGSKLPEGTEVAFRRNLSSIIEHAQRHGSRVALMTMPYKPSAETAAKDGSRPVWVTGLRQHNDILRELAETYGCVLVDAERWNLEDPAKVDPLFKDPVHVTAKGKQGKSRMIVDALDQAGWLEPKVEGRPTLRLPPPDPQATEGKSKGKAKAPDRTDS